MKKLSSLNVLLLAVLCLALAALLGGIFSLSLGRQVASASISGGITDPNLVATPGALPLPPVGQAVTDPVFDTTLRRLSDDSQNNGFGTHIYSQLQAFSADNAYVLLSDEEAYLVRRMSDFSRVDTLDTSSWNAPRWQPAVSHTIVHYDSNADTTVRAQYTNVDTAETTTVFTFPAQYDYIRNNQSFDELSRNGRWMAGMLTRNDGAAVIFALDLQNQTLGAQLPIPDLYAGPCAPDPEWGEVEPDWIGVSPLGNYLVVQWVRDGTTRCSGLETFDLQTGNFVGRAYDGHQHGDMGLLPDGTTEIFMTFELYHPSGNLAIGYRELPGTATVSEPHYLITTDWHGEHISCQGPNGVCLVTTYGDASDGWSALEGELFLLYTDGTVNRLAHHRSSSCGYWVQPRASLSADGRYAIFASDWYEQTGSHGCGSFDLGAGDPFIVDLSGDAPQPTPTNTPPAGATDVAAYLPAVLKPEAATPTATATAPSATATATPTPTNTPTPTATGGDGSFVRQVIDDQIVHGQGVTAVDLDTDGDEDVLASLSLTDAVYLYVNGGDSSGGGNGSTWETVPVAADDTIVAMDTATADFDNDGNTDIAAAGLFDRACTFCAPGEVTWYENPGSITGNWATHVLTDTLWGPIYVDAADFTGDNLPDLAVATIEIDGQGGGLYWLRNGSSGSNWSDPIAIDTSFQDVLRALAHDVDGDGVVDIVAVSQSGGEVFWYENGRSGGVDNNPTFSKHTIATPPLPYDIELANVDADPALELIVTSDDGTHWYDPPADPANPWTSHTVDTGFGQGDNADIHAADFNGDGRLDIAVSSNLAGELRWYRHDGGDSWSSQPVQAYGGLSGLTGADVDGDGRIDLITSTYEQQPGADELVWWRNTP